MVGNKERAGLGAGGIHGAVGLGISTGSTKTGMGRSPRGSSMISISLEINPPTQLMARIRDFWSPYVRSPTRRFGAAPSMTRSVTVDFFESSKVVELDDLIGMEGDFDHEVSRMCRAYDISDPSLMPKDSARGERTVNHVNERTGRVRKSKTKGGKAALTWWRGPGFDPDFPSM